MVVLVDISHASFTCSWCILLGSSSLGCHVDVLSDYGSFYVFKLVHKFHELSHSIPWSLYHVFITDNVDRHFCVEPEFMKISPNCYLQLYIFKPVLLKCHEVLIAERKIVRIGHRQVKQTRNAIDRITKYQHAPFGSVKSYTCSFRVMAFDDPNTIVHQTFSLKTFVHKSLNQTKCYVGLATGYNTSDLFHKGS